MEKVICNVSANINKLQAGEKHEKNLQNVEVTAQ